jgi:hypothetical protein
MHQDTLECWKRSEVALHKRIPIRIILGIAFKPLLEPPSLSTLTQLYDHSSHLRRQLALCWSGDHQYQLGYSRATSPLRLIWAKDEPLATPKGCQWHGSFTAISGHSAYLQIKSYVTPVFLDADHKILYTSTQSRSIFAEAHPQIESLSARFSALLHRESALSGFLMILTPFFLGRPKFLRYTFKL